MATTCSDLGATRLTVLPPTSATRSCCLLESQARPLGLPLTGILESTCWVVSRITSTWPAFRAAAKTRSTPAGQRTPLASAQSPMVARCSSRCPSITSTVPLAVWATLANFWSVSSAGPHGLDLDRRQRRVFVACDGAEVVCLGSDNGKQL